MDRPARPGHHDHAEFPGPGQVHLEDRPQGPGPMIQGKLTAGNGLLTLAQDQGAPMVGNVTWSDETHFTFKVPGAGPMIPGCSFTKAP